MEYLLGMRLIDVRDTAALVRADRDQPFGREHADRLSYGRAAGLAYAGQLFFTQMETRREAAVRKRFVVSTFHGVIAPTMPIGSRTVYAWRGGPIACSGRGSGSESELVLAAMLVREPA